MMPPGPRRRTAWPGCQPTACTASSPAPATRTWSQTKKTPPPPRRRSSTSSHRSAAKSPWSGDPEPRAERLGAPPRPVVGGIDYAGPVAPAMQREAGQGPVRAEPPPPTDTLLQTTLDTYRREHHTLSARGRTMLALPAGEVSQQVGIPWPLAFLLSRWLGGRVLNSGWNFSRGRLPAVRGGLGPGRPSADHGSSNTSEQQLSAYAWDAG